MIVVWIVLGLFLASIAWRVVYTTGMLVIGLIWEGFARLFAFLNRV